MSSTQLFIYFLKESSKLKYSFHWPTFKGLLFFGARVKFTEFQAFFGVYFDFNLKPNCRKLKSMSSPSKKGCKKHSPKIVSYKHQTCSKIKPTDHKYFAFKYIIVMNLVLL